MLLFRNNEGKDMKNFFAYMARMKLIKRWSLMKSVSEENIAEHSAQVAQIAHALAVIENKRFGKNLNVEKVVLLAQYHEVGEVITGDLPTPIKYFNPEIEVVEIDTTDIITTSPGVTTTPKGDNDGIWDFDLG